VATLIGGAIYIFGANIYHLLDSAFHDNAVMPAAWASTASYALHIFTGDTGTGMPFSAMWAVEDGPVFGLGIADCAVAREASARGIQRGLAPSWPGSIPCANGSVYYPQQLYAHTLELATGVHVLHIGVFARQADYAAWVGRGRIDVTGLLDPMYPQFDDDRSSLRTPGCISSESVNKGGEVFFGCKGGESFWIEVPLHVTVGQVRRAAF
jgi:hypothetical protein